MVQVLTLQQEMDLLQIATYRTLQADRLQHLPLYTYWDFGSVAYSWLFLTAYYNSGTSIPSEQGDDQYNCLLWARHKEPNSPIPITGILKLCKMCYEDWFPASYQRMSAQHTAAAHRQKLKLVGVSKAGELQHRQEVMCSPREGTTACWQYSCQLHCIAKQHIALMFPECPFARDQMITSFQDKERHLH